MITRLNAYIDSTHQKNININQSMGNCIQNDEKQSELLWVNEENNSDVIAR